MIASSLPSTGEPWLGTIEVLDYYASPFQTMVQGTSPCYYRSKAPALITCLPGASATPHKPLFHLRGSNSTRHPELRQLHPPTRMPLLTYTSHTTKWFKIPVTATSATDPRHQPLSPATRSIRQLHTFTHGRHLTPTSGSSPYLGLPGHHPIHPDHP